MAQVITTQLIKDRNWIIDNESDYLDINMNAGMTADPGTATPYQSISLPGQRIPPGLCAIVRSITVSVSKPCNVFGFIIKTVQTSANALTRLRHSINLVLTPGTHTLNFSEGIEMYEGGQVQLSYIPTTDEKPAITVQINGITYTNDHHYSARNVYMAIGDSKSWGTIGNIGSTNMPNFGDSLYSNRISNQLRSEGVDVRCSNRGFGGAFSGDMVYAIRAGLWERTVPNLLTIDVGANDAAIGTAGTPYTDNVKFIINYFLAKNPNCSIVLLGPPPTDETSRVANIGSYRTALQAIAELPEYADVDLFYCDTTPNLTVNNTNYVEQVAGTRLHPKGDTGHLILYNNIYPVIQQTKFYIDNLPE